MFISARSVAVFVAGMLASIALSFGTNLVQLSLPSSTSPEMSPSVEQAREPTPNREPTAAAVTAPRPLDHGRSQASKPQSRADVAGAVSAADQTSALPTEPGPRIYIPLTGPEQAVQPDSSVPYPEKALVELHYAFQTRDATLRELLSVQAQQVLETNEAILAVFAATEGLFVVDGHTTVLPHVYRVPFRFVLPGATAGETRERAGNAVVRQTSDGRWYIDNFTLPQP